MTRRFERVFLSVMWTAFGAAVSYILFIVSASYFFENESIVRFVSWASNDTSTVFAPEFSEKSFARVRIGMDRLMVNRLIGPPLLVDQLPTDVRVCVQGESNGVKGEDRPEDYESGNCSMKVDAGEIWYYTQQGDPVKNYEMRRVIFSEEGKVLKIENYFFMD